MSTTGENVANLRKVFLSNEYHYNNVTFHMLKNVMGTKSRAKNFISSSDPETSRKLLETYAGLNEKTIIDKDGNVNVKKLQKQTRLLKNFFANSYNMLAPYMLKTLDIKQNEKESKKAFEARKKTALTEGQKVVKSEFSNSAGDGMVDILKSAGKFVNDVDAINDGTSKKFLQDYARWVSGAIGDLKNNFADALKEEIGNVKATKKPTRVKRGTSTKSTKSTALITAEMAEDINRIKQIGVGDIIPIKGVKKGMDEDKKVSPADDARDDMLNVDKREKNRKTATNVVSTEGVKKEKKNNKKAVVAGLILAATLFSGAGAGFGVGYAVGRNQRDDNDEHIIQLTEQLEKAQEAATEWQNKYNNLRKEYDALSKDYENLAEKSKEQGATIVYLRGELDNAMAQIAQKDLEIEKLKGQIVELKKQLEDARNNGDAEYIAYLEGELENAYGQIYDLEIKWENALKAAELADQKYKDLLSKYDSIMAELRAEGCNSVGQLVNKYQTKLNNLQAERDDYYQKWQDALKNKDNSEAEYWKNLYNQKVSELNALQTKYDNLSATAEALKQQVKDLEARIAALEAEQNAAQTTSGAKEGGSGASQMSTGSDSNDDDQHVNGSDDSDLSQYESDVHVKG